VPGQRVQRVPVHVHRLSMSQPHVPRQWIVCVPRVMRHVTRAHPADRLPARHVQQGRNSVVCLPIRVLLVQVVRIE